MRWLIYGIIGSLLYGFLGIFNKLNTADPVFANLIIQSVFFFFAVFFIRKNFRWSFDSFLSGAFGAAGTGIIIAALKSNQLIVVYPFAALSVIVFLALNVLVYHVRYAGKRLLLLLIGLIISCIGLFFASVGGSGGIQQFSHINTLFLAQGIAVLICWGLFAFFLARARVVKKQDANSVLFCNGAGAFLIASLVFFYHPFTGDYYYPLLGGICGFIGTYFVVKAFGQTEQLSSIKNIVLTILSTGDIIPVTFLALVILKEFSVEGIIGSLFAIIGIVVLSLADNV
ncbi:MAG TPA: hypothetical protein VJH88_06515 [Candidatus Nanoarchaeia archaeon]|nr:hypothetical protein [Candidatus Nanoarchaeia archaeon]